MAATPIRMMGMASRGIKCSGKKRNPLPVLSIVPAMRIRVDHALARPYQIETTDSAAAIPQTMIR
jgi:hypothetical protein